MRKGFTPLILTLFVAIVILIGVSVFLVVTRFGSQNNLQKSYSNLPSPFPPVVPKQDENVAHLIFGLNGFEDLKVSIDNQDALINPVEYVRNHCNWNIYEVAAKNGPHTLKVTNDKTKVEEEKNFTLENEIWFFIYYAGDNSIRFQQSDVSLLTCE